MFTLLCYFLCVWLSRTGRTVCRWLIQVLLGLSWPLLLMNLTFAPTVTFWGRNCLNSAHSLIFPSICSRLERCTSTPIFSFSEAFNLRSGLRLALPHIASAVVQTGACLWPPGRIERKSAILPFTLSPFWSHERRKWNTFILGFPLLSTLHVSFLLLLFVEHARTQTPGTVRPCSAVDIQKGPEWMAGICMHWLSACLPNISAQLMALLDTLI